MRTLAVLMLICSQVLEAAPAVIGHPGMGPLDLETLQRIYTGKVVEVKGLRVTPVNLPPGNPVRERFLDSYLHQNDDNYIGYWTVRRYVGKGAPPRELGDAGAVIQYVTNNAGAIGYVDESELKPELNVLYATH